MSRAPTIIPLDVSSEYFFDEGVRVAREIGSRSTLTAALLGRAELFAAQGEGGKADECREQAGRIAEEVGLAWRFGAGTVPRPDTRP